MAGDFGQAVPSVVDQDDRDDPPLAVRMREPRFAEASCELGVVMVSRPWSSEGEGRVSVIEGRADRATADRCTE